jgi:hypothetical protein
MGYSDIPKSEHFWQHTKRAMITLRRSSILEHRHITMSTGDTYVKRLLLDNYLRVVIFALVVVMIADIIYWLLIAPHLQECVGHVGAPPYCQDEAILVGSPQPPSPFPVVFLVDTYPVLVLAILLVIVLLPVVAVYLELRGSTAKGAVLALQLSPLLILIAIGIFALLPPL